MDTHNDTKHGIIAWFARNSVAANLLMVFIIVMGIASFATIQRQMFPNIEINYITVTANYPGASPQEIEESILLGFLLSLHYLLFYYYYYYSRYYSITITRTLN